MTDDTKIQWKWVAMGLAPTWAPPVLFIAGLLPLDARGVLLLPVVCLMYLTALGQAYIRKTRSRISVISFVARYSVVNFIIWVLVFFFLIVRDWHYEI